MNSTQPARHHAIVAETQAWITRVVIGLNLCPFAKAVHVHNQIRFVVCDARDESGLLIALLDEMQALAAADPRQIDTTLLIHPKVLTNFIEFNRFLGVADNALARAGLEGILQLASFHPRYRFAGTAPADVANATNRSPYPMLHLLREASVERAVASFPDTDTIYQQNELTLRELGTDRWQTLLRQCAIDARDAISPTAGIAAKATRPGSKAPSSR
jgi:hypothetical protein